MGNDRCRWVRRQLPLLAGGELGVNERRRVERHLIGCPGCRERRDAAGGALAALRMLVGESPARVDAPSLWPALAAQIRQSRHVPPRPSLWDLLRPRLASAAWPAMGLAMGLGGAIAGTLPRARELPRPGPVARIAPAAPDRADEIPPIRVAEISRGALPEGPAPAPSASAPGDVNPFAPPSARVVGYDLDFGTPVMPGNRDPQRTY